MSKKKTTTPKSVKTPKPTTQVKKDAKGRFWLVPKDGGAEQGPFDTKKQALDAKAGAPAPKVTDAKARSPPRRRRSPRPRRSGRSTLPQQSWPAARRR